ncbi:YihY/virulence factor BrkB family protein [Nocardioides sp. B-3]|uniref:YihY/virulence factor BrkB family protein n=1 Tax=Nocardioides sp. B-3 TaxID=2895565 RepID=UPI0021537FF6|nr:YhjD/YihY/BrkB family envelope integrity protein [Nocardioides sp. B-3]UUZ58006.1 YihY/virulence factor BrkB family protein [Nocardioides sp. B-3]
MSIVQTAKQRLGALRERRPFVDHVVRTFLHYGSVNGNGLAGAVTFFGFLSFFPIMALAFFVVGRVSQVYDARDQLIDAINGVLPGMVSADGAGGTISLEQVQSAAAAAAGIGVVGVLYSGLGWLSGMREALMAVFEMPKREKPNFVVGKVKDLLSLATIGPVLIVSVAIAGAVTGFSDAILDWVGLDSELGWALGILAVVIGLLANMLLFFVMFKLLADPHTPTRSLWSGALLGALGFEVLKQLSTYLMSTTKEQPAFRAFGIALILVVWINYFSRVVMYAAAWAHTSASARALLTVPPAEGLVHGPQVSLAAASPAPAPSSTKGAFAAGAGVMLALVAVLRRKKK